MVTAVGPCVSCVNFRGSFFFVSQHSSRYFRTTTMTDIFHISVNTGQICMEFEADTYLLNFGLIFRLQIVSQFLG